MPTVSPAMERILRSAAPAPCCSLYLPTHRAGADREQDRVRFRKLLHEVTRLTTESHGADVAADVLAPAQSLLDNNDFWATTQDGLAVFAAPDLFEVIVLQREVPERAFVADSFHTKPLRRILQSSDRFALLGVSRSSVRLFVGNRDRLDAVAIPDGIPRTIEEALGSELTEPTLNSAGYGTGARGNAMFHGHGGKSDEVDADTERFFRAVDRAVHEKFSQVNGLPVLLVALGEHHATFRAVSHNPLLLPEGIAINPDAVETDALRAKAWELMEPHFVARLAAHVERFGDHRAHDKGDDDLANVALAAIQGRVRTLLIDADVVLPGTLDRETGQIVTNPETLAGVDDLLDDIAEEVVARGGEVVVVPSDTMPTSTGLAAIYGY
jgi:hypothetical protein